MSGFTTYTRPRRAAVSPAARLSGGPVTQAIRALRPNEMPTWEIREAEMRRQEAADMRALRRRVAKAVSAGIDFLDATGGDPDLEDDADFEPSLCGAASTQCGGTLDPSTRLGDDREPDAGEEPEEENEHGSDCDKGEDSLGSLGGTASSFGLHGHGYSMVAEPWGGGAAGDIEEQNEDGDNSDDEPGDNGIADGDGLHWGKLVEAGLA